MIAEPLRKTQAEYDAQRRVRQVGDPRPIDPDKKLLLDYEDVASLTGLPLGDLRNRVRAGKGPRLTLVGKHHRFARKDVHAWVDDMRSATEAA